MVDKVFQIFVKGNEGMVWTFMVTPITHIKELKRQFLFKESPEYYEKKKA